MKTLVCLSLLFFLTLQGHAEDSEALREIHQQRKALLKLIAKQAERDYEKGICSLGEVINAKVRLNTFQRNLASDRNQKRVFQKQIVEIEKWGVAEFENMYKAGSPGVSVLKLMQARDRHLSARQKLLEIEEDAHPVKAEPDAAAQKPARRDSKSK